jgi:hypothetical protein
MKKNEYGIQLERPHKLEYESIDKNVEKESPGIYTLGTMSERAQYLVAYVGRSAEDLRTDLKAWVGKSRRPLFTFEYASSPEEAFKKQCRYYHFFQPPDNKVHPQPPDGEDWSCPEKEK